MTDKNAVLARDLFDNWSKNYPRDMKDHTGAIIKLFDMNREIFIKHIKEQSEINVFDPAVGEGSVLLNFLSLIKDSLDKKSISLHLNDISSRMIKKSRENLKQIDQSFLNKINFSQIDVINNKDADKILKQLNLKPHSMDMILASQIFDLIPGYQAKRKLLTLLHLCLKRNGWLVMIGEEPPLFSLSPHLSAEMNKSFLQLFEGIDSHLLAHEILHTPDTKSFYLWSTIRTPIDVQHSMYLHIAEKLS